MFILPTFIFSFNAQGAPGLLTRLSPLSLFLESRNENT